MGCMIVTLIFLSVIIGLSYSKPSGGAYESKAQKWETDFLNTGSTKCSSTEKNSIINEAKMKSYPSKLKYPDELAAARIVNMYTQPKRCFYEELNRELRENNLSERLREYSVLLNEAIDMLSKKLNTGCFKVNTYRGTGRCDEITSVGRTTLKGFTSTSTDPKVPLDFKCRIYIYFKNVKGLDVSKLSAISSEREVLLKSNYPIDVTEYVTDEDEIVKMLKKISKKFSTQEMKAVKKFVKATSVKAASLKSATVEALSCNKAVQTGGFLFHTLILCLMSLMLIDIY